MDKSVYLILFTSILLLNLNLNQVVLICDLQSGLD